MLIFVFRFSVIERRADDATEALKLTVAIADVALYQTQWTCVHKNLSFPRVQPEAKDLVQYKCSTKRYLWSQSHVPSKQNGYIRDVETVLISNY